MAITLYLYIYLYIYISVYRILVISVRIEWCIRKPFLLVSQPTVSLASHIIIILTFSPFYVKQDQMLLGIRKAFQQMDLQVSLSLRLMFKGLFLYTVGILFNVEWRIKQIWCSLIILCNIISVTYNNYTDIYPHLHI